METPPTFGLVLPSSSGIDVWKPESIWELAERADRSQLQYLWVSDHIVWWTSMYESLTLLTAISARTKRIRLGTAVLLLALRNPVVVAKTIASIQVLSGGRLTLGVGIGGEFPLEWESVGVELRTRASRTDEMLEAVRGLLDNDTFGYHGKRISFDPIPLRPRVPERPPFWIGGRSEASIRRAAKHGDGWMGLFLTPEKYEHRARSLKALLDEQGRDPKEVPTSLYIWTAIADTTEEARRIASALLPSFYNVPWERLERYAIAGSPQDAAARFREFTDAGVRHFAIAPIGQGLDRDPIGSIEEVASLVSS